MRALWCVLALSFATLGHAQAPAQPAQPATSQGRTASQAPPPTVTPQSYPPELVRAGQPIFAAQCGFCHGRDAAGGESGPDLTRSMITAEDNRGDKIAPLLRSGRPDKGMPAFSLAEGDVAAIVAYIHDQKRLAESQQGSRRTVDIEDLQTGDADAGRRYFNGGGGCARCHSPSGDLAGIATRLKGLTLLQRMLNPGSARGGDRRVTPATIVVTLPSGERITGTLESRDEFTIALRDSSGWYRSFAVDQVKFSVNNPLDAHYEQLGKYTDEDMHNVLAYLQTLR